MSVQQMNNYLQTESNAVKIPYIIIGLVVLTVAILVWRTALPEIKEQTDDAIQTVSKPITEEKNLWLGVGGIFFFTWVHKLV